jgi:hypothetical protein
MLHCQMYSFSKCKKLYSSMLKMEPESICLLDTMLRTHKSFKGHENVLIYFKIKRKINTT